MTEGELHPLYGSESELARCFEFLSEAVARARLFVTTKMLRSPCNDRVQGTPLGRLQRALRDEARTWPDPLPKLRPGRDYRSAVKKKRDEIERYLKQYQLQERQLTIAAQCFNFGEAVVDLLADEYALDGNDGTLLRGALLQHVVGIARHSVDQSALSSLLECVERAVTELRRAASSARSDPSVSSLAPPWPSELGEDADQACALVAPLAVRGELRKISTDDERRISTAWSLVKALEAIARSDWNVSVYCDAYVPDEAGELSSLASSEHPVLGAAPAGYVKRFVKEAWLHAGAAICTGSYLPNDEPSVFTNFHHVEEGAPRRSMAAAFETLSPTGGLRSGALFVGIRDTAARPLDEMLGLQAMVLITAETLSREFTGRTPTVPWHRYMQALKSEDEFIGRLTHEIATARPEDIGRELAIIVVSAVCAVDSVDDGRHRAVAPVLDAWAKNTALRLADGHALYELGPDAYVFVRRDFNESRWRSLLPEDAFSRHRFAIGVRCSDGQHAGTVGMWTIRWRTNLLFDARDQLGHAPLRDVIAKQVQIAAQETIRLNEMREAYAQANYARAHMIASDLVAEHQSDCGMAIGDKIHSALLVGDPREAKIDSDERKCLMPWDLDAHANFLLANLALGDVQTALIELDQCEACRRILNARLTGERVATDPMLVLAIALVRLASGPSVQSEHWRISEDITNMLQDIAPSERDLVNRIRRAIMRVQLLLRGGGRIASRGAMRLRTPGDIEPGRQPVETSWTMDEFNDVRDEFGEIMLSLTELAQDVPQQLRLWKEREALSRIVIVIRSMLTRAMSVTGGDLRVASAQAARIVERSTDLQLPNPDSNS